MLPDTQFGHLCSSFSSSPSLSPAIYLRCSVAVMPWKKRNYCLELIFVCFPDEMREKFLVSLPTQ